MLLFLPTKAPRLRFDQWLSLLILFLGVGLGARQAITLLKTFTQPSATAEQISPRLRSPAPVPVFQGKSTPEADPELPPLTATAVYIMDRGSGSILYKLNPNAIRYPASTAKMLTALLVRKIFALDEIVEVKQEAYTTGSVAGLKLGERLTVENLLKAMMIHSGNDAAFALANHHQFGYKGFTEAMNALAKQLHLDHSQFRNPSGLDLTDQTSTARDLAVLANEVMKDDTLRQIVATKSITITDESGLHEHLLENTNELLGTVDGVIGIKTGTTEHAGENLIIDVNRKGHEVIIVVLGSQHRFEETKALIDWVFAKYDWQTIGQVSPQLSE